MNDPKRLMEEMDSPFAKELLRAGSWSPWPNSRRNRVLAALGVGLALTSTKQTAFAALATWQKVAVVGCIACAGAGGAVALQQVVSPSDASVKIATMAPITERRPGEHGHEPSGVTPVEVAVEATEERTSEAEAPARATPAVAPVDEARTIAAKDRSSRTAAAPSAATDEVRRELAMLERARKALRRGAGDEALTALSAYSRRFPKGNLRFEAEVLRIEALAVEGRTAEASRRAKRILKNNPRSVVAPRLERYVTE